MESLSWQLTPTDYDFELFIEAVRGLSDGLERVQSCVYWEYARESVSLRDDVVLANLIHNFKDGINWETRLTPLRSSSFPSQPWTRLGLKSQTSFLKFFTEEEIWIYSSLGEAVLRSGVNPFAKSKNPEAEKRVIIVNRKTMARYGMTKLTEKIAAELQDFASGMSQPTSGRGKKFNDYAKRLRVLGYCRLRAKQGQQAADAYVAMIRAKKHPISIRDWDAAKASLHKELHSLFPFIPATETPIHGSIDPALIR